MIQSALFSKSLNKDMNTMLLRGESPAYEQIRGIDCSSTSDAEHSFRLNSMI